MITAVAVAVACCLATTLGQGCVKTDVVERRGALQSPNFPQRFSAGVCHVWNFSSLQQGEVVTLSFSYLDLPRYDNGACHSSYIEIGSHGHQKLVCGQGSAAYTSSASQQHFAVRFFAGSHPVGRGFQLAYFVGPAQSQHCSSGQFRCGNGKCIPFTWTCNGVMECQEGDDEHHCSESPEVEGQPTPVLESSTSPSPSHIDYYPRTGRCSRARHERSGTLKLRVPAGYEGYVSCVWKITVPGPVDSIVLRFLYLGSSSYVGVYNGTERRASQLVGAYTRMSIVETVTSHSSTMLVELGLRHYYYISSTSKLLFLAEYAANTGPTPAGAAAAALPSGSTDRMPKTRCLQRLYLPVGNFTMPAHPLQPSDIQDCMWVISKLYPGSHIHLLFTALSLGDGDTVSVMDGWDGQRLAYFNRSSHLSLPASVRSSGSQLVVSFVASDLLPQSRGHGVVVRATYHFEDRCATVGEMGCGEEDGRCYRPSQRCDGVWHCPVSGADEAGCNGCSINSYSCHDLRDPSGHQCYYRDDRCSGFTACDNFADEDGCDAQMCSEKRDLFLCDDKRCVSNDYLCDGVANCLDKSDELNCGAGNSFGLIMVLMVGFLVVSLLMVLLVGCSRKLRAFGHIQQHTNHHQRHRRHRYDTPLTPLQEEMFGGRAPPPPYHEAMRISLPYEEAVRDYVARTRTALLPERSEQDSRGIAVLESAEAGTGGRDRSTQNVISAMESSETSPHRLCPPPAEDGESPEVHAPEEGSSSSQSDDSEDSEDIASADHAEDSSGHIEMLEQVNRGRPPPCAQPAEESTSQDCGSTTVSAVSCQSGALPDQMQAQLSCSTGVESHANNGEESDRESLCILTLADDPAAEDDGTDTRCLLQHV